MHVSKDAIKGRMLAELIAHYGSLVEQHGQGQQGGGTPGRKNKNRRVQLKEKVTTEEVSATPAAGAAAKAGTE